VFQHLVRRLATLALAGSCGLAAQVVAPSPIVRGAPLGINLSWWTNFHPEWVFVDAFKGASFWVSQRLVGGPWDTFEPFPRTAEGYPASLNTNQAAACVLFKSIGGRYPGGRYTILWDGDGEVEVREDAREVSRNGNRILADVTPNA